MTEVGRDETAVLLLTEGVTLGLDENNLSDPLLATDENGCCRENKQMGIN